MREKTSRIGVIGRTTAIFSVDEIIVYPDDPKLDQTADANLVAALLTYMETPQYLRKRLFKLEPELRYAGILPPLRTPHHTLNRKMKNLKVGEYREGVTISMKKIGTLVDIGVEKPAYIINTDLPASQRVTVRITRVNRHIEAKPVKPHEIPEYWGYKVTGERSSLGKTIEKRAFDLTIGTSKHGIPFADVTERIEKKWKKARTILVAFGSPKQGLHEIFEQEGTSLEEMVDFTVNMIPEQGTETIRTEEALMASLAILGLKFPFNA